MIQSSFGKNIHYLSQTASGYFVEVVGDPTQATREVAAQIRQNFPESDSDKMHRHHLIPQAFREDFKKLGIDIDDYAVPIPSRDHIGKTGIHNAEFRYNNYWSAFMEEHEGADPTVTRFDAMMCIVQCMSAFNISFGTTVRYGS